MWTATIELTGGVGRRLPFGCPDGGPPSARKYPVTLTPDERNDLKRMAELVGVPAVSAGTVHRARGGCPSNPPRARVKFQ